MPGKRPSQSYFCILVLRETFQCEVGESGCAGRCCLVLESGSGLPNSNTLSTCRVGHCPIQRKQKNQIHCRFGLGALNAARAGTRQGLPLAVVSGKVEMWQFTHQIPHCPRASKSPCVGFNDLRVPDHALLKNKTKKPPWRTRKREKRRGSLG